MAAKKGTECEDLSDWVLLEADCSDVDENENVEDECDNVASDLSDLVDNASITESQGLSLQLFRLQEQSESDEQLHRLKRKYLRSPDKAVLSLSPRLETVRISPKSKKKAKKQLFADDSGIDLQHEVDDIVTQGPSQSQVAGNGSAEGGGGKNGAEALLLSNNKRAYMLGKFKSAFGLSFLDLVRTFQSNRTCSLDWVLAAFFVHPDRLEACKLLFQDHCTYVFFSEIGAVSLWLLCFKNQKSRETLWKLCEKLFNCKKEQLLSEPPRTRSTAAALYWVKKGSTNNAFTFGLLPEWISKLTLLNHQLGALKPFDLSTMIQWAYDNELTDECEIAYKYASLAETDDNAAAFLNSNSQAKHVKDCATMCRYYRKAEMQQTSMSRWIYLRGQHLEDTGGWKQIALFLRHQDIEFITFLSDFKKFLKGIPKKNCLVLWGPPNTGKSWFCMSLLKFLRGKVISYVNSQSQFWLQPLTDAKIGLLDDATSPCWKYIDTYLRNVLDGNPVSIDCKHKAPIQIKCPPLLVTTNVDVMGEENLKYLHSRISAYRFATPFPFDENGNPGFDLNDENWASFFKRFWQRLDLSDQEDEADDGESQQSFRASARRTTESL
ncbi:replication protein E1 [Leopardus wiedii papillomavirus type 1]|uniref:Replication protein E1 n=1 Tax=Leopardus wiedii papillomavirus type 1 TaxID=2495531 RepID=A0A3Q8UB93_9PAPI|nr:replication protein E1 [Leopardus wiedii papillomavirus type 1]